MYLGVVYLSLELDPEVTSTDRERLLRSIRDKVRQIFGNRITTRTDDNQSIAIAYFDDNYARAESRGAEISEKIDAMGEARVDVSTVQIFNWFDGFFKETRDSLKAHDDDTNDDINNSSDNSFVRSFAASGRHKTVSQDTIRYVDEDEDVPDSSASRYGRKISRK